ncbi:MAG: hypothetical protein ACYTKD_29980 [Planctomycetota bacterium]|jgi:hypothetical protein
MKMFEIVFEAECRDCGGELDVVVSDSKKHDLKIEVESCPLCKRDEYDTGYSDGEREATS